MHQLFCYLRRIGAYTPLIRPACRRSTFPRGGRSCSAKLQFPFVNFFRTPCITHPTVLEYYVACYIYILEVIVLQNHYGHLLRVLHWCTDQAMTNALEAMDLTAAQGRIMGFLAHRKTSPCSRDIEDEFHLSHPTVSGLLSRLEQKGFIEFRPDPTDRRCKRIYILPKGKECDELMHQSILTTEKRIVQGFTETEQAQFADFLHRAIVNMGGSPCHHHHKEEPNE